MTGIAKNVFAASPFVSTIMELYQTSTFVPLAYDPGIDTVPLTHERIATFQYRYKCDGSSGKGIPQMNLNEVWAAIQAAGLTEANRPIRMRLSHKQGMLDDVLMVQRVEGRETLCGGLHYELFCVSTNAFLALKQFVALPVEIQFVTDRGQLFPVSGIVEKALSGGSDGGLALYRLTVKDALAFMDKRINTRVFRQKSEVEITQTMLEEWRKNSVLASAFDIDFSKLKKAYPPREFTMQQNESDAAFLKRLWKRSGISWFVQAGESHDRLSNQNSTPLHRIVLFDDTQSLDVAKASNVRFHAEGQTEERDTITTLTGLRTLVPASVNRHSWDYQLAGAMTAQEDARLNQGSVGNALAASLDDYFIDPPHAGDSLEDYQRLGQLRMLRHEYQAKCWQGQSSVRDIQVGHWLTILNHPELDTHSVEERQFVLTELVVEAENNLPKPFDGQLRDRFIASGLLESVKPFEQTERNESRYTNRFTCVRRDVAIVPEYDPRLDLPKPRLQTATVVGPEGEEVFCDEQGRIKVRFPSTRPEHHSHAQGAGASDTDTDSAWVRVASTWAGEAWGAISLPRVGQEVILDFLGGDPDKPIIIGSVFNAAHQPPNFSHQGKLPENRFISGIKSKEIKGTRYNQLRLDDTESEISAQLASEHANAQLNLGYLTQPRANGKGEARGEGFELITDKQGVVRGGAGLFLTAEPQPGAVGRQLDRDTAESVLSSSLSLSDSLSEAAQAQGANATETGKNNQKVKGELSSDGSATKGHLNHLLSALRSWAKGTNVDKEGTSEQAGGQKLLVTSAPDGMAHLSGQSLAFGAVTNVDHVAGRDTNQSTGRRWVHNAGESISLFVQGVRDKISLKLIAAAGKVKVQAVSDELLLLADKTVTVTSNSDAVQVTAKKEILLASGGGYIRIKGGNIEVHCPGQLSLKGAGTAISGGTNLAKEFNKAKETTFEKEVILRLHNGDPAANRKFQLIREDGSKIIGRTDAAGQLGVQKSDLFGNFEITILE